MVLEKYVNTNTRNNYFLNVGKTLYTYIISSGDPLSSVDSNFSTSIQEWHKCNVIIK